MKIKILVKPHSKISAIEELGNNEYLVRVKALAQEGEANEEVIRLLAKHFATAKSCVKISRGLTSRYKTVIIE